ncbi:uncharacterized protein DS421_15g504640 [Arachis hypogaea]|nr:uncharacterized protein DS421_15g504640 [Arachis hypogaea]
MKHSNPENPNQNPFPPLSPSAAIHIDGRRGGEEEGLDASQGEKSAATTTSRLAAVPRLAAVILAGMKETLAATAARGSDAIAGQNSGGREGREGGGNRAILPRHRH